VAVHRTPGRSKNYSFIYTWLFDNTKARIPKSIITWSEMGQQISQAKKVFYTLHSHFDCTCTCIMLSVFTIGFSLHSALCTLHCAALLVSQSTHPSKDLLCRGKINSNHTSLLSGILVSNYGCSPCLNYMEILQGCFLSEPTFFTFLMWKWCYF